MMLLAYAMDQPARQREQIDLRVTDEEKLKRLDEGRLRARERNLKLLQDAVAVKAKDNKTNRALRASQSPRRARDLMVGS